MDGGTTYYFVADGIESALTRGASVPARAKTDFPAATSAS
jgi:hypothetical protein